MKPARSPRTDKANVRLLVVKGDDLQDSSMERLPDYLETGDLLVVNDAATLPASLSGRDRQNNKLEIRLTTQLDRNIWQAVVFGEGNWLTPTEERPSPPRLAEGEEIIISRNFSARVINEDLYSERLLNLEFNLSAEDLWRNLYQFGKPVQYSYMNDELRLWSVQNVYSSRPWAVEMPSAGHALNWQLLLQLSRKGVSIASLTHGAGLSSTGEAKIDEALPLTERFDIPASTMNAVSKTKANGRRVIAIGTSVVRALESASLGFHEFTNLKLGPEFKPKVVDGLLTGTHDVSESHYRLLQAFLPGNRLEKISQRLEENDYLTHEFGDSCLILRESDL